jgi:uncharacterized protein (DUF58 family)
VKRIAWRTAELALWSVAPLLLVWMLQGRAERPNVRLVLVVQVVALAVPLLTLGAWHRIFPHRGLILLGIIPVLASIGMLVTARVAPAVWFLDAVVVTAALVDLWTVPRQQAVGAQRTTQRIVSLGQGHAVELTVANTGSRPFFAWVRDGVPLELQPKPAEFEHRFGPRSRAVFEYQLHARRRGAFNITGPFVRARSRFGLWARYLALDVVTPVHVYPDLKQLERYAVLARLNRLNLLGVRRTRRVGQDNEFERLRDYIPGDSYKHIDWRSTARRRKLTVRDFQQNQSQRLMFLIDCGRMMTNEVHGLSLLDHALNAMLMLSYVALNKGDAVGLLCFSDEVHCFVPPRGGMRQMNRLLHASFDRFPKLVESRYDLAFLYLAAHVRKRSLVTLFTNLIDEVNSRQVEQYLGNLAGRHLPLGVVLRDRRVYEYVETAETEGTPLFRSAAAAEILAWRQQVLRDLHSQGVLILDEFPENLTAPLINEYLAIKARHLL